MEGKECATYSERGAITTEGRLNIHLKIFRYSDHQNDGNDSDTSFTEFQQLFQHIPHGIVVPDSLNGKDQHRRAGAALSISSLPLEECSKVICERWRRCTATAKRHCCWLDGQPDTSEQFMSSYVCDIS